MIYNVNGAIHLLCPEVREMSCLLLMDGNWFYKFLKNTGFLSARNPPTVQCELISGLLDCLLEFRELEFLLDLTAAVIRSPSSLYQSDLQRENMNFTEQNLADNSWPES